MIAKTNVPLLFKLYPQLTTYSTADEKKRVQQLAQKAISIPKTLSFAIQNDILKDLAVPFFALVVSSGAFT